MILVRLILPMSLASVAAIGLLYAVHHWNEWFAAFIYINDGAKLPLQAILRSILMVYPFVQRYFVKGVMVGGIKG